MSKAANQHTDNAAEPDAVDQKAEKPSAAGQAARFTGKAFLRTTGFDVIGRDAKLLKPRNPQMWRDIFGAEGRQLAFQRLVAPRLKRTRMIDLISVFLMVSLCAIVTGYSIIMIGNLPGSAPFVSKIALMGFLMLGLITTFSYLAIFIVRLGRLANPEFMHFPPKRSQGEK